LHHDKREYPPAVAAFADQSWKNGKMTFRQSGRSQVYEGENGMFDPITLPFGAKMLFNTVKLKPGVTFEEVELAVGDMCNVVKETYGGDKGGFIAGQVFKFSGFVSDEGSLSESRTADEHYVIVTYWRTFEEHEKSHADAAFSTKFEALAKMCTDTKELGYDMLWQGAPEGQ
jgi:hypothetical protein